MEKFRGQIKDWFMDKEFEICTGEGDYKRSIIRFAFLTGSVYIERETDKALLLKADGADSAGDDRTIKFWVPKSCTLTSEKATAESEKREAVKDDRLSKYESLISWAKEQKVKGIRRRMKKFKVLALIENAGLIAPLQYV